MKQIDLEGVTSILESYEELSQVDGGGFKIHRLRDTTTERVVVLIENAGDPERSFLIES